MSPKGTKRIDGYVRASRKGTREGASFQFPEQQRAAITDGLPPRPSRSSRGSRTSTGGPASRAAGLDALMEGIRPGPPTAFLRERRHAAAGGPLVIFGARHRAPEDERGSPTFASS